ncbi:MAG: DJ-1/PfpI family protein [Verrucomicrobia bacterium]|jgi:4-methyl-5(b-hydroxyethyl)-thiazole monophosphate biosynthesis|nr:MAG: DJ-1/PfpI family protein [Verrucomicrobiota bacterium]
MVTSLHVLTVLAPDFEELEVVAPIDLMRRAGIKVCIAATGTTREVKGRNNLVLLADTLLADVINDSFDCLFLPGGPAVAHLRQDLRIVGLIQTYSKANLWIAAICAAPVLLNDAGLLTGKRFTAHPSVVTQLPPFSDSSAVVIDGKLITSRGAGTAIAFGLSLVENLLSAEKAKEIALSIRY